MGTTHEGIGITVRPFADRAVLNGERDWHAQRPFPRILMISMDADFSLAQVAPKSGVRCVD